MTVPLLLVDGHNLLYRAWHGFATRILSRDKNVDRTGVFGFAALLRKAQTEHAAGYELFVAFDSETGALGRVEQDSSYKAHRAAPDAGLLESLAQVKVALDHCGVRWVEHDGCEADDVVATLTYRARTSGRKADIMTADKDFIQLLADPHVRLLNTGVRADLRYTTGEHIPLRYGVHAAQWPDFRALTGDPSDGIAGVHGVGPKTAARLLADGRHLESVPADELRPAWAEQWDQVRRWREMITLASKADLPENLLTGLPTAPLPNAAVLLDELGLW
ncbi:5'-3' exonuclease H3TH domain-containing protein [Streptomyces sp. NPDC051561]|uniref:5'-3' exonuclease n=1 Tax=Streptomyces sp. NPDC051561 TaxID=3365658 RepID=UPI003791AAB4